MRQHQKYKDQIRIQRVPIDAVHSQSRKTPGYDSDLLRDSDNNILGPAESRPVTQDDLDLLEDVLPSEDVRSAHTTMLQDIAVNVAVDVIVKYLFPRVVQTGKSFVAKQWHAAKTKRLAKKTRQQPPPKNTEVEALHAKAPMNAAEYAERLNLAKQAEEFAQKQFILLAQHEPVVQSNIKIESPAEELPTAQERRAIEPSTLQESMIFQRSNVQHRTDTGDKLSLE
ncbi:hypothetical protein [Corynebacterium sp. UMB10321]|uniref:hypothetical protein n=1 Tax=Corynebacterium sp. UMB10321 TaxID=3046312 RepID=UPI00254C9F16|nr:hypothetical protein [Corynebacterium sp. UMB10321]MDK8244639.1 hypothetical protein [Corynebacterium sp. UMB10321]